jgi:hypothetical protein
MRNLPVAEGKLYVLENAGGSVPPAKKHGAYGDDIVEGKEEDAIFFW